MFILAFVSLAAYAQSLTVTGKVIDSEGYEAVSYTHLDVYKRQATEGDGLYLYDMKTKELKNYRYEDGKSGLNSNYVALKPERESWTSS